MLRRTVIHTCVKLQRLLNLCCNHITIFWVVRAWRPETDFILQQELRSPRKLHEPNHRSGLTPVITKVKLYHAHRRREDIPEEH